MKRRPQSKRITPAGNGPSAQALAEPLFNSMGKRVRACSPRPVPAVGVVTRHNDINIVFLLVTVIALMIIPLPNAGGGYAHRREHGPCPSPS